MPERAAKGIGVAPIVKDIYEGMGGVFDPVLNKWVGSRHAYRSGLNVHHSIPKQFADVFGIPESEIDNMPGVPMKRLVHLENERVDYDLQFHRVLNDLIKSGRFNLADKAQVVDLLEEAYTSPAWKGSGAGFGQNVWTAARGWLINKGHP